MTTPHRWRPYAAPVLVILALVLATLLIAVRQSHRDSAVGNLPPEARAQLFQEALIEVRTNCLQDYAARGPLRDHCIDQAHFVLLFPECGTECRTAASAVLPHAHR